MGIYDRSYYREDDRSGLLGGRTMVVNLILLNVAFYVAELLSSSGDKGPSWVESWLALKPDLLTHPWRVYQLLTCGFMHANDDIFHVFWNMFGLWFFGREVEGIYGSMEFLRIYLTLIVMSSLVWLLSTYTGMPGGDGAGLEGASGAVMGVAMIFTMHFPTKLIYIWGVLPVPVWAMMAMYLLGDYTATAKRIPGDYVAHVAHLAGGAVWLHLLPQRLESRPDAARALAEPAPRLKLHDPDPPPEPRDLSRQVDEILAKISREGEASLTKPERRILEEASRRYQRRRR